MGFELGILLILFLSTSLWYLIFFVRRQYLIDFARQRLFQIRDELFEQASNGKFSFDEKLYGMTRTNINGAIRFIHKVSAWRLLGIIALSHLKGEPPQLKKFRHDWEKAVSEVSSDEAKQILLSANTKMRTELLIHIVRGSIFLRGLTWSLATILRLIDSHKNLYQATQIPKVKSELSLLDAEANAIGQNG